jgi:Raf kinase inhibitor-like YbhB/YbcL family protein
MKYILIFLAILAVLGAGYYFISSTKKEPVDNQQVVQEKQEQPTAIQPQPANLTLTSSVFAYMTRIPSKYTCDGQKINPPLEISGVDDNAKSLVLIMEDSDVPKTIRQDGIWNHWLKFNLPVSLTEIKEGIDPGGVSGLGTSNTLKYVGPCPPDKEHRYFFKLYSLDTMLDLKQGAAKSQIEQAMRGHILQEAVLIGLYERK